MTPQLTYDQWLAALCLWREARNCTPEAQAGIWHVLLNRVADSKNRWPKTIPGVVLQPRQFSSFNWEVRLDLGHGIYHTDPNAGQYPQQGHLTEWSIFLQCAGVVLSTSPDPTNGANHYENCAQGTLPVWADAESITKVIHPFRFYKL